MAGFNGGAGLGKTRMLRESGRRLAPTVRYLEVDQVKARLVRRPDRAWYGTPGWKALRRDVLIAADLVCARCGAEHGQTKEVRFARLAGVSDLIVLRAPERVADHIVPHRGEHSLFWDRGNLQCLCSRCHSGVKQSEERSG